MLPSVQDRFPAQRLAGWMETYSDRSLLLTVTVSALAIRLYLLFSNFCISADGVEYVAMAQRFAAGEPGTALASVFSPLYPWLISLLHNIIPNWELAGELISAAFGTATIPFIYLLMLRVFHRRTIALGAAAVAAIHPDLAGFSASVRTEAGYIFLMVAAMYLLIAGIEEKRTFRTALAGMSGGIAYLYRAEGIGFVIVSVPFLLLGALWWGRWSVRIALRSAAVLAAVFLVVASPYLIYLRIESGHWIVSHELNVATSAGMMRTAVNKAPWEALARSKDVSLLAPLYTDPRAYLHKVAYDLVMSFYYFAEALGPLLTAFLVLGLLVHGRDLFRSWSECSLAGLVIFYFCGFSLFNTGPRFMVHLIPYTFGWLMIGFERASEWLGRFVLPNRIRAPAALAAVVALVLLPQTLWPLGYDIRGLRYAGEDIARRGESTPGIVARDNRVAFYAHGQSIELPAEPRPDLCHWLERKPAAHYLLVSRREERSLGDLQALRCLTLIKRYPRINDSYYDLFQINHD